MRVLVADDHSLFRDGLVSLLEAAKFKVIGQAGDGKTAVERTLVLSPELVILDLWMPEQDGLAALRAIKSVRPEIHVVILTASDSDEYFIEAIRSGANGYLTKELNANKFIDLLRGLEKGEPAITRKMAARLMERISQPNLGSQTAESPVLTDREIELLELVAAGGTNKSIAQNLNISENTVKYHIRNIMQKLGVQNRTEAVTHALRSGILVENDKKPL